jgi:hypothetical protein
MAHAPEVTIPLRADPAPFVAVIDIIVRHLTAMRDELLAGKCKAVRYWVLMSVDLVTDSAPMLEGAGLHLIEYGAQDSPGMRWCLFEDDGAPPDLDGKRVELTFTRDADGGTRISDRQVTGP